MARCPSDLRARWNRWVAIVTEVSRRKAGARRITPDAYRQLHRELMEACARYRDADAGDGDLARTADAMASIVEPWMHLDALTQADRNLLQDLRKRCESVTAGRRGLSTQARSKLMRMVLITTVVSIVAGAVWNCMPRDSAWFA